MKNIILLIVAFFVLANLSFAAAQYTVGVSPSILRIEETERGSGKIVKFYIVTISDEPLLVTLEPNQGSMDFFKRSANINMLPNYSEEDVTSWPEFFSNPVELKTGMTGVGGIKGFREVDFLINIPRNAEPGYHLLSVKPVPAVPDESMGGQAGTMLVAVTSINILFKVPGDAIRSGIILDVNLRNVRSGTNEINTYFQNTGTVTVSAVATHKIYDRDGKYLGETRSAKEFFSPGQDKPLKARFSGGVGEYKIETVVDYTTGTATRSSTLSVTGLTAMAAQEPGAPNLLILIVIIIIILVIAVVIYRRAS